MATNVQVSKSGTENSMSLIRRFTKRVQGSGILRRARTLQNYSRPRSKFLAKKRALKGIEKRAEREKLVKLGKIAEAPQRRWKR